MNFLNMAVNKLKNRVEDKFNDPDTMLGRIADRAGLTSAEVATPSTLADPMKFQRGLKSVMQSTPEANDPAATPEKDRFAQQNGFNNYAEMLAWSKQSRQRRDRTADGRVATPGKSGVFNQIESIIKNPGAAWDRAMSVHPKNMLDT